VQDTGVRRGDFEVGPEGVFVFETKEKKECRSRLAARIDVIAQTRNADGKAWGRLLQWKDDEGRVHEWAMPMEVLAMDSREVRARLLSEGLTFITTDGRLRSRFTEYLQTWTVEARARSVARIGWHENVYVLPDEILGSNDGEHVVFQPTHEADHYWSVKGTAEQWRDNVGCLCAGNSRIVLAVSCAFAGPLLSITETESGGVHLYGLSSRGKTTALRVAGSVCGGGGPDGFLQSWRTTVNGLEANAEAHNDATLFLDELAQVDPLVASETAYLLANGQGKGRMTKTLGAARRLRWNLLYVSSGELTLSDHAATAGKRTRGGAEVRLLNIDADAGGGMGLFQDLHGRGSPSEFADELRNLTTQFYGAPFREFVRHLIADRETLKELVRSFHECFVANSVSDGATGEVMRAAARFALIGAAGELATSYGLTGWRADEALNAADRCFSAWLTKRGTEGSSDEDAAVRQVRQFIESHGAGRFQRLPANGDGDRIYNRAGFIRTQTGTTEYLILREVFTNEVCKGYDYQMVAKALHERGFLRRQGDEWTVKTTTVSGCPQARVFAVSESILAHN